MPAAEMVVPDYAGASTISIVPALTWGLPTPSIPDDVMAAARVVVLLLDSLGWHQLESSAERAPTISALAGGPATTVAPSTTAAALTSLSTGLAPGEHGLVGYRFPAGGSVMNALRWTTVAGDHRATVSPTSVQPAPAFAGARWAVVSHRSFVDSAFTEAHLGSNPYRGYDHPSSIIAHTRAFLDDGETRVYAYYDGLDHVAHIHGVAGAHHRHELEFCDWLVARLLDTLPTGCALVITADHGQLDAPQLVSLAPEVAELTIERSGEPRFRWLHARTGAADDLRDRTERAHGDQAWVMSRDEVIESGLLGPVVTDASRARLGDVAMVAHAPVGFEDPAERGADRLVGRHGSLTAAEMYVPVLTAIV